MHLKLKHVHTQTTKKCAHCILKQIVRAVIVWQAIMFLEFVSNAFRVTSLSIGN